jgi:hypothetical protein
MPLLRPRVERLYKVSRGTVPAGGETKEHLLAAIIKWIPVEVLTVYKGVDGLIKDEHFRLAFLAGVIVITPLWIAFATKPEGKRIAWRQVILAPFAFLCWSLAMMDAKTLALVVANWQSWMGSVAIGIGTLLLPVFDGILRALGVPQDA